MFKWIINNILIFSYYLKKKIFGLIYYLGDGCLLIIYFFFSVYVFDYDLRFIFKELYLFFRVINRIVFIILLVEYRKFVLVY